MWNECSQVGDAEHQYACPNVDSCAWGHGRRNNKKKVHTQSESKPTFRCWRPFHPPYRSGDRDTSGQRGNITTRHKRQLKPIPSHSEQTRSRRPPHESSVGDRPSAVSVVRGVPPIGEADAAHPHRLILFDQLPGRLLLHLLRDV